MKIAYPAGGIPTNLTNNAAVDQDPAVSPDGSTVAFSSDRTSGRFEIWVMDSGGGSLNQASGGGPGSLNRNPTWSPDGTKIAFSTTRGGAVDIYQTTPTSIGADSPLTSTPADSETRPAWSPDGQTIAVSVAGGIATFPAAGTSTSPSVIAGTAGGTAPDWQDVAPINLVWPSITPTGPPVLGGTLTVTSGQWLGAWGVPPATPAFTYQWLRCDSLGANCVPISGATGTSYVVTAADAQPTVTHPGAGDGA